MQSLIQLTLNVVTIDQCLPIYEQYLKDFEKPYGVSDSRLKHFCDQYNTLIQLPCYPKTCSLTSATDMDTVFNSVPLRQIPSSYNTTTNRKRGAAEDCQQYMCAAKPPFPAFENIPASMDLRERGLVTAVKSQGNCGSCFVFSAIALWENSMLLERSFHKEKTGWDFTFQNLNLSEYFTGFNTKGFSKWCSGGDATALNNYHVDFLTASNKKYLQAQNATGNLVYDTASNFTVGGDFSAKFLEPYTQDLMLRPFSTAANQYISGHQTPNIELYMGKEPFGYTHRRLIKSYLARGLAVAASMRTTYDGRQAPELVGYNGRSVVHRACGKDGASLRDHAVTFVGYGRYQGKNVWVVRNSWGRGWGHDGYFFVEVGANSFCIEHYAYVMRTQYWDQRAAASAYTGELVSGYDRGKAGYLETDTQQYDTSDKPGAVNIVVPIVVCIVVVGLLIGALFLLVFVTRKQEKDHANAGLVAGAHVL